MCCPGETSVVKDAAAVRDGRVTVEGAVIDADSCSAIHFSVVEDAAATFTGGVLCKNTIIDGQKCVAALFAIIKDARADIGRIAAECAIIEHQ